MKQSSDKKKQAVLKEISMLWDVMPDDVRKGVERALEQSKKGMGKSHEEVMKKYNKKNYPK